MKNSIIMYVHVPSLEHALIICNSNLECVLIMDAPDTNLSGRRVKYSWSDLQNLTLQVLINIPEKVHNFDLEDLVAIIEESKKYTNVIGIVFSDIAVIQLANKNNYFGQLHYWPVATITNSSVVNFWIQQEVTSVLLARELKVEQILELAKNTDIESVNNRLVVQIFGATQIFSSKRKVLTNHKDFINSSDVIMEKNSLDSSYIIEEFRPNEKFLIIENKNSSKIFNSQAVDLIDKVRLFRQNNINSFLVNLLGSEVNDADILWLKELYKIYRIVNN